MKGNDIDNSTPDVVMVHVSCVSREESTPRPLALFRPRSKLVPDPLALNAFWNWAGKRGVRLVLLSYLGERVPEFDFNPFADHIPYESASQLAQALPYRPDIRLIFDPTNQGAFGFRSGDIREVIRG